MKLPPLLPEQRIKPRYFEARVGFLFFGLFFPAGIHLPYFPLWLDWVGFTAAEIGVILAAPLFIRVATAPFISAYADRVGERLNILTTMAVGATIASAGFLLPPTYLLVLLISVALVFFWAPQAPITDSIALSGVRRFSSDYTSMRIWGSISFLVANIICGFVLAATGPSSVPVVMTAGFATFIVACIVAPRLGRPRVMAQMPLSDLGSVNAVIFTRSLVLMIVGAGIVNGAHGFQYAFVSIYWKDIGLTEEAIGVLWACGVVAEIVLLLIFPRVFRRVTPTVALLVAGSAGIVRWLLYPLVWPLGLGTTGFVVMQLMHAFSFGFLLVGTQQLIARTVPEARTGAAQGLAYFANSLGLALVTLVSGPLYAALGAGTYFVMAAVSLLGLLLVAAGLRSAPK
jgi:PPP family 3-phenylpropionic acid transporter